jgi:WD40 repeat protein
MSAGILLRGGVAAVVSAAVGLGAIASTSSAVDAGARPRTTAHLVIVSNRDGDYDVYSIRADGRRVGALTRNRVADEEVRLSPAGGWLAINRTSGVVLVRADGRRERKLGTSTSGPSFSPDGRWLAFARETDAFEGTSRIELVEVGRDRPARRLGGGVPIGFSADGRRLAYADDEGSVGVLELASGRRTRVATANMLRDSLGEDWSPNLTGFVLEREPDGVKTLLYFPARRGATGRVLARGEFGLSSRWLDEHRYGYQQGDALVAARVDGSARRVIARGVGFADWSPDGSNVAYSVGERSFVIASTTTGARRTTRLERGRVYNLNWSPSGRRLAVTVADGNRFDALVVDARTRRVVRRLRGYPGFGSWSPDERLLATSVRLGVSLLDIDRGTSVRGWAGGAVVVGWLRGPQPPALPTAAPAPPTEIVDATGFRSRTPVLELASDGAWVAALLAGGTLDREHVVAWRPQRRTVVRFASASPVEEEFVKYQELSLKGTVVSWTSFTCGNYCYLWNMSADVRKPLTFYDGEEDRAVVEQKPPRPPLPVETKRGVTATARGGLIELRHTDGRRRTIRPPGPLTDIELEETGLFYAYTTTGTFRGRVVFVPFDRLLP